VIFTVTPLPVGKRTQRKYGKRKRTRANRVRFLQALSGIEKTTREAWFSLKTKSSSWTEDREADDF